MTEKTNSKQRLKNIGINVLIFLSVYYAVHLYQTRLAPSGEAPTIKAPMVDGQLFQGLGDIDKPVLVHFWATWCKICQFEHGSINDISKNHSVISIASQSGSVYDVRRFIAENQIQYPVINDSTGELAKQWGIVGYPTSFVIDENLSIRFVEVGFTSEWGLRFRLWMADLF